MPTAEELRAQLAKRRADEAERMRQQQREDEAIAAEIAWVEAEERERKRAVLAARRAKELEDAQRRAREHEEAQRAWQSTSQVQLSKSKKVVISIRK